MSTQSAIVTLCSFLTFCFLLGVGSAPAAGSQIVIEQTYSGSAVPTGVDADADGGNMALTSIVSGNGTFGPFTATSVSELATEPRPNELCPDDTLEFASVVFAAVERFETGELLYLDLDPDFGGATCVDPRTGGVKGFIRFAVRGGTGRLEGATGTLELRAEGVNLVVDSEGGVVLASVFGNVHGVIELAE